ncbi:putative serine esterase-domain-containing protein [Lentinula aff. lateritia]|uniref:Serine esterase-domain-containing protein n=1 Tax=Lentinula aff. lateritia TaxID=2804960 RepID=A0ACC1U2S3_9AGAR|nr:putative serine esterase-domain-containing protein [Lentinula aff. lateritia]
MSSSTSSNSPSLSSNSVHLLVLVHGMWGNPGHLAEMERIVKEVQPELHVLLAETNKEDSTYDGVDWGGERVAQEIVQEIAHLRSQGKHVRRFSITGYSLGGLVSRYVVGILTQRGLFSPDSPDVIVPVNFNTIATPHFGLVKYNSFFSAISHTLGPKLLSRTGEQFYCVDKWGKSGRPLLDVMSDPNLIFYQSMAQFKHVRIYANALNDLTVPYVTAAIETEDPFAEYETNGLQIEFLSGHHPILSSYSLPYSFPPKSRSKLHAPSWLRSHTSTSTLSTPILPPFLIFRFPVNILVYASIPILIPMILTLALVRLSLASRSSKARISLLEKKYKSGQQTLAQALVDFEKEVEGAVADLINESDPSSVLAVPQVHRSAHPILSPLQKTICARLNAMPHLRKERAFITGLRNTHSTIISREPKVWDKDGVGLGVLRHWAGSLQLSVEAI